MGEAEQFSRQWTNLEIASEVLESTEESDSIAHSRSRKVSKLVIQSSKRTPFWKKRGNDEVLPGSETEDPSELKKSEVVANQPKWAMFYDDTTEVFSVSDSEPECELTAI